MIKCIAISVLALTASGLAFSAIDNQDLPQGTTWYVHADLDEMRATAAGQKLYAWLEDEVIVEINEEFSIDLTEEVDRVTAFSTGSNHYVAIVEGRISKSAQDRVMMIPELRESIVEREHRGMTYYHSDGVDRQRIDSGEPVSGYFSFAIPGRMIASSSEESLKSLLDSEGVVAGTKAPADTVFVLSADRQFVQAGMRTAELADHGGDWQSNILRNTEQVALLVSDQGGLVAVVARLVSSNAEMTRSLANIVNGLLALQMFSTEIDPGVADVLRNTRVEVEGEELSVSTVIDPDLFVRTLGD